jgi:ATP synthase protein I
MLAGMAALKHHLEMDRKILSIVGRASAIGLHMVSGVAVGCGLGWLLDLLLGTRPWLLLVFLVLGVAAGFRNVWLDTQRIVRAQEKLDQEYRGEKRSSEDKPGAPPGGAL